MRKEVIDAFKSVGIADETAWKAAEALSEPGDRLTKIEGRLDLHSWMLGLSIALNITIIVKLFVS